MWGVDQGASPPAKSRASCIAPSRSGHPSFRPRRRGLLPAATVRGFGTAVSTAGRSPGRVRLRTVLPPTIPNAAGRIEHHEVDVRPRSCWPMASPAWPAPITMTSWCSSMLSRYGSRRRWRLVQTGYGVPRGGSCSVSLPGRRDAHRRVDPSERTPRRRRSWATPSASGTPRRRCLDQNRRVQPTPGGRTTPRCHGTSPRNRPRVRRRV